MNERLSEPDVASQAGESKRSEMPSGEELVRRFWEAERRAQLAERRAQQASLRAERTEQQLESLTSSASWRITRPVRALKRALGTRRSAARRGPLRLEPSEASPAAAETETRSPQAEQALVPILIDGIMRSGTTLLMQLLGTSPRIAFDRVYPYEHRYFRYLYELCRQIGRDPIPREVFSSEDLLRFDTMWSENMIGPVPWGDRQLLEPAAGKPGPELWKRCLRALWGEFSAGAVARAAGPAGGEAERPVYYAEKTERFLYRRAREVVPVQPLVLIRDPRDVWLSVAAFDAKRGYFGFGRREGESEADYLERFVRSERARLRQLLSAIEEDKPPIVRYEQLASDLDAQAERLSDLLGVRLDPDAVIRDRGEHAHHMTSGTPEESVARWRREMDDDVRELFRREMGEELAAMGYEP